MNAIDAAVRLPRGALPLHRYARFYALRPDGKIAILFDANTRDEAKRPKDYGCSEMTANDTLKDIPCPPDNRPRRDEQRWVEYRKMPMISDGGCGVINAIYDPRTKTVVGIGCNGVA